MRVLLGCSLGGTGHLLPAASVARALARLGHEAVVLVPPSMSERATAAGLTVAVGAQPPAELVDEVWARVRRGPREQVAAVIDREIFADHAARAMLAPAQALFDEFRPDVILREPCEYATAAVAHRAQTPQAQIAISQAGVERHVLASVADVLDRHQPGLSAAIASAPYLTRFPASMDPSSWPDTRRFHEPAAAVPSLPDWWNGDDRPLIYVTFGTVFPGLAEAEAAYRTAVAAVSTLPARVLMTVSSATPMLDPLPANVHVEAWVPQAAVLDQARLVVCHGGSGTVFGALAAGVPLLVCPFFADQAVNAELVEAAGAGRVVRSHSQDAGTGGIGALGADAGDALGELAAAMLDDAGTLDAARTVAAEMARAPALDRVLEDLLARTL